MCQNKIRENTKKAAEGLAVVCQCKLTSNNLALANDLYRRIIEFEIKLEKEFQEEEQDPYAYVRFQGDSDFTDCEKEEREVRSPY